MVAVGIVFAHKVIFGVFRGGFVGRPLTQEWHDWLRTNRDRGCDPDSLRRRAEDEGFDVNEIAQVLFIKTPEEIDVDWVSPLLVDSSHRPRAWRLDTPLAQVYEIPGFLSLEECCALIAVIDDALVPSEVTTGPDDYRTSSTCHLADACPALAKSLDGRFSDLLGFGVFLSEPLQGQRYAPGQYFKAHTDWFNPGTDEFDRNAAMGGQRTWTVMVYLNFVEKGGETLFHRLGRAFTPVPGMALAWNNLCVDGSPNIYTLHEALPVEAGVKYVITKWFRQRSGRWR